MSKRDSMLFFVGAVCGGGFVSLAVLMLVLFSGIYRSLSNPSSPVIPPAEVEELSYAFQGYCPVTLVDDWQWKVGNRKFQERKGEQIFLFASSEQQAKFQLDPIPYLPAFSGNDIVLAKDENQTEPGHIQHGMKYRGRMYLFASEETLAKFAEQPTRYWEE